MSDTEHLYMPEDHMDKLYNSNNPFVSFVHNNRLKKIVDSVPCGDGFNILDAGCGEGHLLKKMYQRNKNNSYYGVDIVDVALDKSKERCSFAKIDKMSLSNMKYDGEFFDVIVCTEVIEHIHDYNAVILEFKRLLKTGGYLILTFPNERLWTACRFILRRRPVKVLDHVNSFNPEYMRQAADMDVSSSYNFPFGLPFFMSLGCLLKFKK